MIRSYLRARRLTFALFAFPALLFPIVCWLYGYDARPAEYTSLVWALLMLIVCAFDYARYASRLREMREVARNLSETEPSMPEPASELESLYQDSIRSLCALAREQGDAMRSENADRLEYYVMWLHQIKTPIAAIRLSREQSDPVLEQELFTVERYVEMALQYARMSEIEGDLVIEQIELRPLVSACVKKYALIFIRKGLSVALEPFALRAPTDGKWLSFVVEQILSNAAKYTKKGGLRVYARERSLIFEDTGIGVRAEDVQRVFERGYTGLNGRLDRRASGLGLYMSKRVCRHLGVGIALSSELGRGTRVTLSFPDTSEVE